MNEDIICMMFPANTDYAPGLRLAVSTVMEHMGFVFEDIDYIKTESNKGYVLISFSKAVKKHEKAE